MELIYRGEVFEYTPVSKRPRHTQSAVNWRFQSSNPQPAYSSTNVAPSVHRTPTVNWRFRSTMEEI